MKTEYHRSITILTIALITAVLSSQIFAVQSSTVIDEAGFSPDRLLGKLEVSQAISMPGGDMQWQSYRFSHAKTTAAVLGKPIDLALNFHDDESLKNAAISIVRYLDDEFGFAYESAEVVQILHGWNTKTLLVTFSDDGQAIYGAYAALTFNGKGELASVKGRGYGRKFSGAFKQSPERLVEHALSLEEYKNGELLSAKPVWFPILENDGLRLHAATQIELTFPDPQNRPVLFIDAQSAEVLATENRVVYDNLPGETRGSYRPFRPADRPVTGVFPHEIIRLNGGQQIYSTAEGAFSYDVNPGAAPFRITSELRGRWVDVNYEDGNDAAISLNVPRVEPVTIEWTRDNSRDDERMLYYHTNLIHTFWKEIDPNFQGMDRVIPATCEYDENYDNAFWNGQGMFFGNGPTLGNLALKGDVIHHEYTHGVTGSIYPWNVLPYEGESGALNEAWSDYFPCSLSDEPFLGEHSAGGAGAMRNINNNLVYPDDWFGEVHYDSRIVSAAMWHSREALGKEVTDPLFHFARYELGNTFITYFTDVLLTDDDDGDITNGTPNYVTLYEQFGRHGIGPGIFPKIIVSTFELSDNEDNGGVGDGDGFWEAGETLGAHIVLERLGELYPPPAENVSMWFDCDNPFVEVQQGANEFGDMNVGDDLSYVNFPLITIRDDAELSFADIRIRISAEGLPEILTDTLRIAIGTPKLLLVRDAGEGDDRTHWFRKALDRQGVIYSEFSVADPHVEFDNWLEQVESVIWFTGDAKEGFLSGEDQARIAAFIENGGNFVLTGQSIGRMLQGAGFLESWFGVEVTADSINQFFVHGVDGDPVGRGLNLLALGSQGAMNQRRPAAITAIGNGIECFHWARLEGAPAAGVRMEHEYSGAKTLFFSFGIEAIGGHGGTNTLSDLMEPVLDWFNIEHSVPEPLESPVEWEIGTPYPNPFNGRVTVPLTLPQSGMVTYAMFDLSGREMISGSEFGASGRRLLTIDAADWGSGYYFLKIESNGVIETKSLILVR